MNGLDTIFSERSKFIIIGLTGRTGSGCTTVAELLKQSFGEFNAPRAKTCQYKNDEERKYKVVYDYLSQNWKVFHHIKMSDIVSTFILELSFNDFDELYKSTLSRDIGKNSSSLDVKLKKYYEDFSNKRLSAKAKAISNLGDLYNEEDFKFYFDEIPEFSKKLKRLLNKIESGSYTKFFQTVGNNIRQSGVANISVYNPTEIYKFSQRANMLIKILRHKSRKTGENVCVVLDAIRNPYEAFFFKDRYSAFYLMSISTEISSRHKRLLSQPGVSNNDVIGIDSRENPSSLKGESCFWSLDIQRCIEIADVHLYNPEDNKTLKTIKQQLVKYLALIMHPGLITPSQEERCMQIAINAKLNSGCLSRQVGAVVTDSNCSIKSVGWNNVAQGQTPCNLRRVKDLVDNEDELAFSKFERENSNFIGQISEIYKLSASKPYLSSGKPVSFCFKDIKNSMDGEKNQVHTRALHAEENAFLQISKYGGMPIANGYLFTTASPCELCAKKAYQLGISKVIYIDPYPGISNDHILTCGNKVPKLQLFHGAIGRAYQQIFTPIIPYKDELEIGMNLDIPNKKKILIKNNENLQMQNETLLLKVKELEAQLANANTKL
jgi:deoxycytidylate deaminase